MTRWLAALLAFASAAMVALAALLPAPSKPTAMQPSAAPPTTYTYEIVHEYPHDAEAFTQGLIYRDGFLYESTGLHGQSSLRKARLDTGEVVQLRSVDPRYFAEGLTDWNGTLVQLTPMRQVPSIPDAFAHGGELPFLRWLGLNTGVRYDIATLEPQSTFAYTGDAWGLTRDDRRLIMSDGTSRLRFLDPDSSDDLGRLQVTDRGRPVVKLNELEIVNGEIYANVWFEDRIAIIQLDSGQVTGWIDLTGLASRMDPPPDRAAGEVLNGIAYDAAGDRLFVTGKRWPRLFEIRLRPPRTGSRR